MADVWLASRQLRTSTKNCSMASTVLVENIDRLFLGFESWLRRIRVLLFFSLRFVLETFVLPLIPNSYALLYTIFYAHPCATTTTRSQCYVTVQCRAQPRRAQVFRAKLQIDPFLRNKEQQMGKFSLNPYRRQKDNVDGNGQMFATCSSNQVQSSLPSSGSLLRGSLTLAHGTRYCDKQHKSRSRGEENG